MGNVQIVETMLANIDMLKFGSDFLAHAVLQGQKEMVDLFIEKGADVMNTPDTL